MKRILLCILIAGVAFSSCKKDSLAKYEIEKSYPDPGVRFEELKKAIAAGTDGFKMVIESSAGGLTGGYVKFDGTSSAKFVTDNSFNNAAKPNDASYKLAISQTNSVLSFGKASKFAVFATSVGGVDTAYSYKSSNGDTLKFVGDEFGAKMNLIKSTKAESDDYLKGKMADMMVSISSMNTFKKYFKRLSLSGKSYDIRFDEQARIMIFDYNNGGSFKAYSVAYAYSNDGVELKDPMVDGAIAISSLGDLVINAANSTATVTVDGKAATLTNEAAPVIVDKMAANRFNSVEIQWFSPTGFTKDGVSDYLGLTTLSDFSGILMWPKYDVDYDLAGFIIGEDIAYGPAIVPSITDQGTVTYDFLGFLGEESIPTNPVQRAIVLNTTRNYIDPQGFYVIQTSKSTYDFVGVKDGQTWISYQ